MLQESEATERIVKRDGVKIISKSMRYHISNDLLQERGRKLLQTLPNTKTVIAVLIVEVCGDKDVNVYVCCDCTAMSVRSSVS